MNQILDDVGAIKKLDSLNMLGSLELLEAQLNQVSMEAKNVKIPASYKKFESIVILGMGGSTLGGHIIKSVFANTLSLPLEIVNGYHVPNFVNKKTLVIVSSYSGTTEEPVAAMKEALKKKSKLIIITSGGTLAAEAKRLKLPALVFSTNNNPCGSPRMGLGYSIVGQILLFSKLGVLKSADAPLNIITRAIAESSNNFGVKNSSAHNSTKQLAYKVFGKTVWYFGAEHLAGSVHAGANQMNENAKRFAGYFLIPELNHHLLEGMMQPATNKDMLCMILVESNLYDKRVQKRFSVTKEILNKNGITFYSYQCTQKTALGQAMEMLVFTSYFSYYSALVSGIDPTAIPFVDFFKEALKK